MTFGIYNAFCDEIDRHLISSGTQFKKTLIQRRSGGMFREDVADWRYLSLTGHRYFLVPIDAVQRTIDYDGDDPAEWARRIKEHLEYRPG